MKENLIKASIILGGGFLAFLLLKPKNKPTEVVASSSPIKSFDNGSSAPPPSMENAEIVATAYASAMQAGEAPSRLTELNKECMKDFGMRCYMDKEGKLVVCDVSGNIIMTK